MNDTENSSIAEILARLASIEQQLRNMDRLLSEVLERGPGGNGHFTLG